MQSLRTPVNKLLDDVPTSLSDHHHRAWCVPDDRVRDASHQCPPYPPRPCCPSLSDLPLDPRPLDDLPCDLSHHKMGLYNRPTSRPYSFHFPSSTSLAAVGDPPQDGFRHLYPFESVASG